MIKASPGGHFFAAFKDGVYLQAFSSMAEAKQAVEGAKP
jgi:hypothetical protein